MSKEAWEEFLRSGKFVRGQMCLKMNITEEQRTEWVKALRSGDYVQGRTYLKSEISGEVRHCCLGVLLETLDVPNKVNKGAAIPQPIYVFEGLNVSQLPHRFGNPFGKYTNIATGEEAEQLTALNDTYRLSFNEIADVIESFQLEGINETNTTNSMNPCGCDYCIRVRLLLLFPKNKVS